MRDVMAATRAMITDIAKDLSQIALPQISGTPGAARQRDSVTRLGHSAIVDPSQPAAQAILGRDLPTRGCSSRLPLAGHLLVVRAACACGRT
jgi:hypothetical protein